MNPQLRDTLATYLKNDNDFRAIYDYTKQRFEVATELTAHNWEHVYRDVLNSIVIGETEGADMSVVLPATVMHDIGFLYGAVGPTHGAVGAERLVEYLQAGKITLSEAKVNHIADCLRTHKGSMHGEVPGTLEAKVVSDADMLEKFGPIGLYQTIRTYTEFNYPAAKVIERLNAFGSLSCQTATGRRLIEGQVEVVIEFARQLSIAYEPYYEEKA
jgi:HD superfamily phosphodiesterase